MPPVIGNICRGGGSNIVAANLAGVSLESIGLQSFVILLSL